MNAENDNWGRDPSVQRLRHIFASMEQVERTILRRANLPPFDRRLRHIREATLRLFEDASSLAAEKGLQLDESTVIDLYATCLGKVMRTIDIVVSDELFPGNQTISELVNEAAR